MTECKLPYEDHFFVILKQSSCSQPAIKLLFSFSNLPLIPLGETSVSFWPHSLRKPMATSTESSVEFSNSKVRISRETTSWAYTTQDSSSPHCNQSTPIKCELYLHLPSVFFLVIKQGWPYGLRTPFTPPPPPKKNMITCKDSNNGLTLMTDLKIWSVKFQ